MAKEIVPKSITVYLTAEEIGLLDKRVTEEAGRLDVRLTRTAVARAILLRDLNSRQPKARRSA